jgi:hypothetical protein
MRRPKRRAERYAAALIAAQNTVRNWTHEQAGVNLTGAYMAGYRSASRARKAVNLRVLDEAAGRRDPLATVAVSRGARVNE